MLQLTIFLIAILILIISIGVYFNYQDRKERKYHQKHSSLNKQESHL